MEEDEAAHREVQYFVVGLRLMMAKGKLQEILINTTNRQDFDLG